MKRNLWIVAMGMVLLLLGGNGWAHAQEAQTITVKGEGWFDGRDALPGKDRAIRDALVKAVEQAVGTLISSETRVQNFQVLNDEIYTRSEGFVKTYEILNEKQAGNVVEVTLRAIVATGPIKDRLDAMGLLLRQVGKPRLLVLIAEQNVGQGQYSYSWGGGLRAELGVAENTLMDRLREKGFDFVDPNVQWKKVKGSPGFQGADLSNQGAASFGKQTDAEVVIAGKASAKSAGSVAATAMKSVQADISVRAIQTDDGRVISSGTGHAAAVHIHEFTAGVEAMRKAASKISDKLIEDITRNFQKRMSQTMVQLRIIGLSGPDELRKFRNLLRGQVRGVEGIYDRGTHENVARMDVDLQGSAQSLAEEISRKEFSGFRVKVLGTTWNTIEISVAPLRGR